MSDKMKPMSFEQLMTWVYKEYKEFHCIFGIDLSDPVKEEGENKFSIFGSHLAFPLGPAAGPHTQMAQNIITAYVAGARFFELKTVQVMDGEELSSCISKPCITAEEEAYNCEWSTELTLSQAFEEYVKAWIICKILAKELNLGDPDGFVFNMSVGYDLTGIQSVKVDTFIENMKNARHTAIFQDSLAWILDHIGYFHSIDEDYVSSISPVISNSVTESTLHGCSPEEIASIAEYLMHEKGLHTYIKCNPTLLGYDFVRTSLDRLGYDYMSFDNHHFEEDLQWKDAKKIIRNLMDIAKECHLEFGLKLSNTLPVEVTDNQLPSDEMYLSGKALYPLTLHMARQLYMEFGADLKISFSGGADLHSFNRLVGAGLWPVTMATNLLKPGGYERISQIVRSFSIIPGSLKDLEDEIYQKDSYYQKDILDHSRKYQEKLPLLDCFIAPCQKACPINQDIPAFIHAYEHGREEEAFQIILEKNPLPFITASICHHPCSLQCMRRYYDHAVDINGYKWKASGKGYDKWSFLTSQDCPGEGLSRKENRKVAIVGGGPAGLAAAYFLSRQGLSVTLYEKKASLGGIVKHVIPEFRMPGQMIENDIKICQSYGARFITDHEISSMEELTSLGYDHIILATGAWNRSDPVLQYGSALDALDFLEKYKCHNLSIDSDRKHLAVIGGGNTAIDVARAAIRLSGIEKVSILYRRGRKEMPGDWEELKLALEEGVIFQEYITPIGWKDGILTCENKKKEPLSLQVDLLVQATGQKRDLSWIDPMNNSMISIIGDANHGPASVAQAIADAQRVTSKLCGYDIFNYSHSVKKKADTSCFACSTYCGNCVSACPNRANIAIGIAGNLKKQILHIDDLCNECGNCAVFCPYKNGKPYREKFTWFSSKDSFMESRNQGFTFLENGNILLRFEECWELTLDMIEEKWPDIAGMIQFIKMHR